MNQSLESHPKACKVSPMTVSPLKTDFRCHNSSFPVNPKTSESFVPADLIKRSVADDERRGRSPEEGACGGRPIHPLQSLAAVGPPRNSKRPSPLMQFTSAIT
uniref:Uncharacterized protein n=1 Tax=Knipowitschia caucasica TaxID=637954 RepID=A0AAV2JQ53_KNICA